MTFLNFFLKIVLWKIASGTEASERQLEKEVRIIQNKIHNCKQEKVITNVTHIFLLLSKGII